MITLEEAIEKSGLHKSRLLNVYLFGSVVYGTASSKSDYDILIIAKTPYEEKELVVDNFNIHILTLARMMEGLRNHNIGRIESLLSPYKLLETVNIPLEIKLDGLRHSISHTVSNSFVKSKKKINQGDYYIGIKSLFHSIRIALFGIQLVENNNIIDWTCANYIWDDLCSKEWTWDELNEKYKPLRNELMTKFRLITNK